MRVMLAMRWLARAYTNSHQVQDNQTYSGVLGHQLLLGREQVSGKLTRALCPEELQREQVIESRGRDAGYPAPPARCPCQRFASSLTTGHA
jgi:hypothetical protein